jgi:hypothetical protein
MFHYWNYSGDRGLHMLFYRAACLPALCYDMLCCAYVLDVIGKPYLKSLLLFDQLSAHVPKNKLRAEYINQPSALRLIPQSGVSCALVSSQMETCGWWKDRSGWQGLMILLMIQIVMQSLRYSIQQTIHNTSSRIKLSHTKHAQILAARLLG